jgi:hypothetical protein
MKLVEVAQNAVLCEVIRRTNEVIAEFLGWILIAVLRRDFGCAISDSEAKAEVRRLREMMRNSVGGER